MIKKYNLSSIFCFTDKQIAWMWITVNVAMDEYHLTVQLSKFVKHLYKQAQQRSLSRIFTSRQTQINSLKSYSSKTSYVKCRQIIACYSMQWFGVIPCYSFNPLAASKFTKCRTLHNVSNHNGKEFLHKTWLRSNHKHFRDVQASFATIIIAQLLSANLSREITETTLHLYTASRERRIKSLRWSILKESYLHTTRLFNPLMQEYFQINLTKINVPHMGHISLILKKIKESRIHYNIVSFCCQTNKITVLISRLFYFNMKTDRQLRTAACTKILSCHKFVHQNACDFSENLKS